MRYQTKNPIFKDVTHTGQAVTHSYVTGDTATFSGIATKTAFLISIVFAVAGLIWINFEAILNSGLFMLIFFGSMIVSFISVLVASFSKNASPVFAVIYAIAQGALLGSISYIVYIATEGYLESGQNIVFNAISITFIIFIFLLVAYSTGIFKVSNRFRRFVMTALFGVIFFYMISAILSIFGMGMFRMGADSGLMLVLSIAMVLLASFTLLIDFDNCKMAVNSQMPKRTEWYLSLGLLVGLLWLYVEVLRLLLILSQRKK